MYVTYKLFYIKDKNKKNFLYRAFTILKNKDSDIICINDSDYFAAGYNKDKIIWIYHIESNSFTFDGISYYLDDSVGYDYLLENISYFDLEDYKKDAIIIKKKTNKEYIKKEKTLDYDVETNQKEVITFDESLYFKLKKYRDDNLPKSYKSRIILYIKNEVLQRIVLQKPKTKYELCSIKGFTNSMYKRYGYDILEIISRHIKDIDSNTSISKEESVNFIDDLINGIDPDTKEVLPDSILNRKDVINNLEAIKKHLVNNDDQIVDIYEIFKGKISITGFTKRLNDYLFNRTKTKVKYKVLLNWLIEEGYLFINEDNRKEPTEKGKEIGISYRSKKNGDSYYYITEYNKNAQIFILDNILIGNIEL